MAVVTGIVLVAGGAVLVWAGLTPLSQYRDADDYLLSDPLTIERPTHAVTTNDVELLRGHYDCAAEETFIFDLASPDEVRMRGVAADSHGIFIGVAPADAVERYLEGVAHDEITEWDCNVDDITSVTYTTHAGSAVPSAPGTERFWVVSASGSGNQTVDWRIESGAWAVVIMNADASAGVAADVRFGALAPSNLDALAWTSFAVGLVAVVVGAWLLLRAARRRGRSATPGDVDAAATRTPETTSPPEPGPPQR